MSTQAGSPPETAADSAKTRQTIEADAANLLAIVSANSENLVSLLAAQSTNSQQIIEANAANLLAIVSANSENLVSLLAAHRANAQQIIEANAANLLATAADNGESLVSLLSAHGTSNQQMIEANSTNLLATVAANGENLISLLNAHGANTQQMIEANSANLLATVSANSENMMRLVSGQLAALSARLDAAEQEMLEHIVRQRGLLPLDLGDAGRARPEVTERIPLDEQFARLERLAPLNFAAYRACLDEGTRSYADLPAASCSTEAHPQSLLFRAFLHPYLRGHVLDVGCGPQPVPSYLAHFPAERIVGIDPISRQEDHPFLFVPGLGEFLPFADASFDVVISATTLDHYYLLDRGLREAARVLRPGGHFVAWITEFAGAPPYDPYAGPMQPYDSEHMYHIDRAWFLPMAAREGLVAAEVFHFRQPFHYLFMSLRREADPR